MRHPFQNPLANLPKQEFVRVWCSIVYLYSGLHPDGFEDADSGWPRALKPMAAEAWKRAAAGELTDDELYPYECGQARLRFETKVAQQKYPWLWSDHFAE